MFENLKIIGNVKKVCSNNRTAFYLTSDNKIYQDGTLIFEGQDNSDIRICKNDFYAFGDSILMYLGDFSNNTITKIDFIFSSECIWRKGAILSENYRYDTSDGKIKGDYYILDFDTNQKQLLFKDLQGVISCLFNNSKNAIYSFENTLKSLSLSTGEYEWEVDLGKYSTANEEVRIREILGIWEDTLVVLMNNNDIVVLVSLSTGQIVAEIRQILAHCGGAWSFGWYFHLEGGYVYLLQQNSYIRINLSTQSIETLWVHENPRYTIQRVSYDEQYAYFMGSDDTNVQPDTLGVFDRKALQIVWQYEQPIYSSKPPQSDGNKLYCLDSEGILHIFERENS